MSVIEPDEDEPGRWYGSLAEAPRDAVCHACGDCAELMDEDEQRWCAECASLNDWELRHDEGV